LAYHALFYTDFHLSDDANTLLGHDLLQIPVAQRIPEVPPHAQKNNVIGEVSPAKRPWSGSAHRVTVSDDRGVVCNTSNWTKKGWINRHDGTRHTFDCLRRMGYQPKSYWDIISDHRCQIEKKRINGHSTGKLYRPHILIGEIVHICKETNQLEEYESPRELPEPAPLAGSLPERGMNNLSRYQSAGNDPSPRFSSERLFGYVMAPLLCTRAVVGFQVAKSVLNPR
jgi:hypothetical protein